MVGADFPKTIELLDGLGYTVVPLKTSRDRARSTPAWRCMSLRWHRRRLNRPAAMPREVNRAALRLAAYGYSAASAYGAGT